MRPTAPARSIPRFAVKAIVTAIMAILLVYLGLSIYGARAAVELPRLPLNASPESVGLSYEEVAFTSRIDNVLLKGWYIPGENGFAIIIVHGGSQNRVDDNVDTLGLAQDLNKKGFGLLLFDLRGRGESEGEGRALMYIEHDLGGAVDYLKQRGYPAEKIGIIGFCSGAAMAAVFASRESIGGLVLDGCFPTVIGMFKTQAALQGIPEVFVELFIPGVSLMAKLIYGYRMVDPVDVVGDIACPILFIHEENDNTIFIEDARWLLQASGDDGNELWIIPNAEHSQGYRAACWSYVEKVANFFISRGLAREVQK